MKKIVSLFVLVATLLSVSTTSATEYSIGKTSNDQKHYIQLDDIVFNDTGIFLASTSEVLTLIQALRCDKNGYYYLSSDETWQCPRCGASNSGKYNGQSCGKCGWPVWRQEH